VGRSHLEFLPSGDATLTRRARKASRLCDAVAMSGKAFWPNRQQSNTPHSNVSPTPVPYDSPSSRRFARSTPTTTTCSLRVSTASLDAWRDGVTMLDG